MRPAKVSDAAALAELQAASMERTLRAALAAEISNATRAMLDTDDFARTWAGTIGRLKPSQDVLVALNNQGVLGFLAGDVVATPERELVYSISTFELSEAGQAAGVGEALLGYVARKAEKNWSEAVLIWLFAGDDATTSMFSAAGFEPAGASREFEIDGQKLSQHLWRKDLL